MEKTSTPGIYRHNGKYEVDKVFRHERIRRRGFASFEDAEGFLDKEKERIRSWDGAGRPGRMLFGDAAMHYIGKHASEKKTLQMDIINLRRVLPFIGHLPISEIHEEKLTPFIEHMRKGWQKSPKAMPGVMTPYKNETINKSIKMVTLILNLCARRWRDASGRHLLEKVPELPLLSNKDARPARPLSWKEQETLMSLLPEHLAKMILFDLQCGVRENVVCNLKWEWEIFVEEINASVFVIPEEHVKGEEKFIGERLLVCNSVAQQIIDGERGKHGEYVFTYSQQKRRKTRVREGKSRHKVEREIKYRPVQKMNNSAWQTARRKAGIPDLRVHDGRATVATRLKEAGVPKDTIREILWHGEQDVTDRYCVSQILAIHDALEKIKTPGDRINRTLNSIRREAAEKRQALQRPVPQNSSGHISREAGRRG